MRFQQFFTEGKQVGTIYHFTAFQNAWVILSDMKLETDTNNEFDAIGGGFVLKRARDGISFTRNFNLKQTANAGGKEGEIWASARIAFDGDKLSNRYKIEPTVDIDNHITRHDQQAEEIIKQKTVKFNKAAVKQIDIVMSKGLEEEMGPDETETIYVDDFDNDIESSPEDITRRKEQRNKDEIRAIEYIKDFVTWVKKQGFKVNIVKDFRRPVK